MNDLDPATRLDFIRQGIVEWQQNAPEDAQIVTRFPPEPNGFLHIGHAKSICLNFGVSAEFGGTCYLRFDDTNPVKEDQLFVEGIQQDLRWLGFEWGERLTYASDYYQTFYDCALELINNGHAYVDSLAPDAMRAYRGTLKEPGKNSPDRERSPAESAELFARMRAGEFADGAYSLRAKIDMAAPNINMRDPILYRIRHVAHQRTGDDWPIYPMYDFAHPISDALEGVTHSLCTLEFEDHRPLYDWVLEHLLLHLQLPTRPRQIEFSRLNLAYTVTSKRKLKAMIDEGIVSGWDDPRMPTLAAMRRRGYPAAAVRDFCARVGVTKKENVIQMAVLENSVRESLDATAPRAMAVLNPLKVTLVNWPDERIEYLPAQNHPNNPDMGQRDVPLSREIYVERDDFMEEPPRKFHRLKPGGEVRLRYGYIIRCDEVVKDADGNVTELLCTYDEDTRSGGIAAQRKVKGTIHWVSATKSLPAEVRLYDRLFNVPRPDSDRDGKDFRDFVNPDSLHVALECRVEPSLADVGAEPVQFERTGYFVTDALDSTPGKLVFNRVVTLRDSWAKIEKAALA